MKETKGLKKIVLKEAQFKEIRKSLANLRKKSNVECIILIDESGQPICSSLKDPETPVAAISALIAGNFAAANELSRLVGESEVKSLLQEGEKMSIYSYRVANKFILLMVFSTEVRFGMVKLYAHQTIKQLEELLKEVTYETIKVEKTEVIESSEKVKEAEKSKQTPQKEEIPTGSPEDELDSVLMLLKKELEQSLKEEENK